MDEIGYLSDPWKITEVINRALAVETDLVFDLISTNETNAGTDLIGKLGGRDVRIEIRHIPRDGAYSESIWVFDQQTNERLGRGNGDRTLNLAVSIYHWRAIPFAIAELN